jgi:outer membrane protein assembly factor BamB
MKLIQLLLTVSSALLVSVAAASDWPQWRGPHRDGIASGFNSPAAWTPDTLVKKWSVAVGEGHASPVVVGNRVFVFSREGELEFMRCLAVEDGKVHWLDSYAAPYEMHPAARRHGKGPKATPAVADGRVFAVGINGTLTAWDAATGRVLWRKSFTGDFKKTSPAFGAAASPLVDGPNVIVPLGGRNSGALTALDAATGEIRWQWTGDGPGYTSPVIGTFGGERQLITQSQTRCLAVSPADGRLLWEIPFTTSHEQNTVTPVIMDDLVILAGIGKPTFAVRVSGTTAVSVWENRGLTMYMSSPVLNGKRFHGMSDKSLGSLFTLDATNGELLWKSEGRLGDNASITDLGSALLVVNTGGALTIHDKSGDALKEIASYQVSDTAVWASPAVAGNNVLIKDTSTLTLFAVTAR